MAVCFICGSRGDWKCFRVKLVTFPQRKLGHLRSSLEEWI